MCLLGCAITRYQKKISGPLLDRIDIHMDVPRVEYEKLSDTRSGEPSSAIRGRVEAALERQSNRFDGSPMRTNADMGAKEVQHFCTLDGAGDTLMRAAMRQLQLSARSYHRILSCREPLPTSLVNTTFSRITSPRLSSIGQRLLRRRLGKRLEGSGFAGR